jgi:membrane peptidoglycan carboxypeptidase
VEQATTFATLADDGLYHTPHVIATLQQNGNTVPSHLMSAQVLSPQAAADVDWALSFDNNMSGATAEGNVPFRRGDVIGKTGTLGTGNFASQAWFNGSTPDQDALSVALFTNDPATENLDSLPYAADGTAGSFGGAWPATIWNNFMTTEFGNTPEVPLFTTSQAGFVPWIQVQAQGQCRNFQQFMQSQQAQDPSQQCTCPPSAFFCNNSGGGGGGGGHGNGGGPSPGPTPSCSVLLPCTSLPPTPAAAIGAVPITGSSSAGSSGSTASPPVLAAEEVSSGTRLIART